MKILLDNYDSQQNLASSGRKYFYLSGNDVVVQGKQGKGGIHVVKTGSVGDL